MTFSAMSPRIRGALLMCWTGFLCSPSAAHAAADCSRINQAAQKVLVTSQRMAVTPLPSDGRSCRIQNRDTGIRNAPVGTLAVTTYGDDGPSLTEYRRPNGRCQPVNGVGQFAELCVLSDNYDHYRQAVAVYRNGKKALQMDFFDWPSPPNSAFAEAHNLAKEILGPFESSPVKEPTLSASALSNDKVAQMRAELLPRAQSGSATAQLALGLGYEYAASTQSAGDQSDYASAVYWYKQAAGKHLPEAGYALGLLYRDGRGVAKDEEMAIRYLREAADEGDVPAILALGMIYARKGPGWSRYYLPLLEKAEASGSAAASNDLGLINYQSALHEGTGFEGYRQSDFAQALKEFRKAAALGDCEALLSVGGMYFNGDGVPQNANEASTWFLKAQNCAPASEALRQRAAQFLAKIHAGRLPAPEPVSPSASGQAAPVDSATVAFLHEHPIQAAFGAWFLALYAVALQHPDTSPAKEKSFQQQMNKIREESDRDWAREMCRQSLIGTPLFGYGDPPECN